MSQQNQQNQIREALRSGYKTKGELLDAIGSTSYFDLDRVLKPMQQAGDVKSSYCPDQDCIVYSLKPAFLGWQRGL